MLGKTHEIVGLTFGLIAAANLDKLGIEANLINSVIVTSGSLAGSLLPDIDHTSSIAGKKMFFVSWPIAILNKFFNFLKRHSKGNLKRFWSYIARMFGHRGICHSGLLWIVFALLVYFKMDMNSLWRILFLGITFGGLSHLVADTFNPSGIPWLLPITYKRFSIAKISTSSKAETIFRWVVIVFNILFLFFLLERRF